jgi:hypothetical protein
MRIGPRNLRQISIHLSFANMIVFKLIMNSEPSDYNHVGSATWTVPEIHTSRCSAGRDALSRHYRQGRRVHWSSFSSASSDMRVALKFAGVNGVLLRLTLLKAGSRSRDIHDLSAVTSEQEVLSLQHSGTL